ncbi:MAG TPA: TRAP transporter substrate-binding protein [Piscinibacter sp.]|jgi:TRAP-type mannitol/chloroaromatic compound transport system substrate-binding protein|uniref:TRAP transporter substrate-binding protein n=1 Tax=Burkholderiales TaxID=80840 RepID=UPI001AE039CA|nr:MULTISPECIES: TRAP transporter substrate-binding protein [Burkholderiales]MBP6482711.1 TRAP transporter substrate-binding protein [Pseudomonadales bacterium]MBK7531735.1 TRAP transporter substrate-binding protein [Piscinibacter sp.]QTN24882.1 TRAP transporter substrate-binding protein [Rhizobacter sp. AJA081-3]HNW65167.1 TRAP transporter substrate-binding protein [Piscinibacter sp.]HOY34562.1 TRAP transporter substrate-binding protein [Piscinibacter sp.]
MERRSFIQRAGIAGVLAAGAAPAVVHAQANIRWRLASSFPKSLDTIYGAAEVMAKQVSDMTGGKFQISVHAGGELMPPFGVVDGVQNGTVEMAHTAPYYFFGKDPTFAMDCAIPFGLNSRQMTAWMYEGNGMKLFREFYAGYNIHNFPMGNTGAQMGGWYRKEIKSLADIKGLKMRIGGFGGKVLERIGGVPQNIPGGEIYQALEKGTIDASEWVGPYDDQKLGLNKVAPNYYYPGWWEGGPQLSLYINTKAFAGLSAEYKAIVENAAAHAHTVMQARYDARNPAALKQLVGAGTKLFRFPKDVMDGAFKAAMEVYGELSGSNPAWKKIYADYNDFRRDQNLMFRFAEAGFDDFMQQQKL